MLVLRQFIFERTFVFDFADSKTLKEKKREELFEDLKANESFGWAVDVLDPRELSSKLLNKASAGRGIIGMQDDLVYVWELSIENKLGILFRFEGVVAVAAENRLLVYLLPSDWKRESDKVDEDVAMAGSGKKQLKLSNLGITTSKRKSEEIESNAKGRCKFFQAR